MAAAGSTWTTSLSTPSSPPCVFQVLATSFCVPLKLDFIEILPASAGARGTALRSSRS